MLNTLYDSYTILNKVYSEKAFIKQAINSTFIEEKNRPLTTKIVYGVIDKDIELSYIIKQLCDKSPKLVIRTILKIAMFSIKYLSKKEYAVIDNAVELTKKLGKGGASGFVNAFLRKFIKTQVQYPIDSLENLSITFSYPLFAVKELVGDYGIDKAKNILSAVNNYSSVVFYGTNGKDYLTEKGYNFRETPFDNVFSVKNFTRNEDYDKGVYTFQSIGSVAICDIVEPCENLLDCCSAPGGKSIRLSYKCKNVVSTDIHEHRVELVNEYAERMGRQNITALVKDSKLTCSDFIEKFDAVLVDAPCSGFGVVYENPDIKLNRDESSFDVLSKEQLSILENACKYVKKGGFLYYSTCTIFNKENINVVNAFIENNDNFRVVPISSRLDHIDKNGTNQFTPDISMGAGFYVAKLERIK